MPKTIIKTHTPKFRGDAPSDWVPGTNTRWKFSNGSVSSWKTPQERLAWSHTLTYEYEVEVHEATPVEVIDDETLANRIFADIKEMKDRGYTFKAHDDLGLIGPVKKAEFSKNVTYKGD